MLENLMDKVRSKLRIVDAQGSGVNVETLAGAKTLTTEDAKFQHLDPDGAGRDVTLPAEENNQGLTYRVLNTASGANALTVKDDAGATVATVAQNEAANFICDGTSWHHSGIESIALS